MRVVIPQIRDLADVRTAMRSLGNQLRQAVNWLGAVQRDPESPADGDVWVREDLPALRLRAGGRTWSVAVTEV